MVVLLYWVSCDEVGDGVVVSATRAVAGRGDIEMSCNECKWRDNCKVFKEGRTIPCELFIEEICPKCGSIKWSFWMKTLGRHKKEYKFCRECYNIEYKKKEQNLKFHLEDYDNRIKQKNEKKHKKEFPSITSEIIEVIKNL